jgi:hypothetical protein
VLATDERATKEDETSLDNAVVLARYPEANGELLGRARASSRPIRPDSPAIAPDRSGPLPLPPSPNNRPDSCRLAQSQLRDNRRVWQLGRPNWPSHPVTLRQSARLLHRVMSMVRLAMQGKLPYAALHDTVLAHPTLAGLRNKLFSAIDA